MKMLVSVLFLLSLTACGESTPPSLESLYPLKCVYGHLYMKADRSLAPIFGDDGKPVKCGK